MREFAFEETTLIARDLISKLLNKQTLKTSTAIPSIY